MSLSPDQHDIDVTTNIVYSIPMITLYGPDIPMPPGLPPTLTLDTEEIRQIILER
jgi:hypothetical protein